MTKLEARNRMKLEYREMTNWDIRISIRHSCFGFRALACRLLELGDSEIYTLRALMIPNAEVRWQKMTRKPEPSVAPGAIEKQSGKARIMRLGQDTPAVRLRAIPTGSIGLDAVLGIGGVPRGRIVEI